MTDDNKTPGTADDDTTSDKTAQVQAEAGKDDAGDGQAHAADASADTESAARAADVDEVTTSTHRKEFVHGPGDYSKGSGFSHDANIAATRQGIINAGLRPVTDVKHVSTRKADDGISKVLAYEAEVIPAHLAVVKGTDAEAEASDEAIVVSYEVAHPEVIQSGDSAPATDPGAAE